MTQDRRIYSRTLLVIAAIGLSSSFTFAQSKVTFDEHITPILRNHCFNCHSAEKKKADFDASSYIGITAGGGSGEVLAAGDPSASLLWKLVNHEEEPKMPPKSAKIPDAELAVIKKWIEGGLLENSGSKAIVSKKPKLDLAVKAGPGRPEGPPPMPNGDLLLEPIVTTAKPGAITAMAASPWAPLLAVAGQKQVILYNTDTLNIEGILPFPEGFPYVIKFSRSGKLLLVAGGIGAKLGKAVLFDITTGKRITEVGDEYDAVLAADISSDQSLIALGGTNKLIRVYATSNGELIHTIKKHTDWVTALAFSPDSVLLASGDRNGGAHIWEAQSGNAFYDLKSHTAAVNDIAWRDDSNVVATAGEDAQIMLWEMSSGNRVRNWGAHGGGVQSVRYAHDARLVSAGRDKLVKLWDPNGGQQRAFDAFSDIALLAAISHDQTRVIGADWTGEVRIWLAADGKLQGTLAANPPTLAQRIEADTQRHTQTKTQLDQFVAAQNGAMENAGKMNAALEAARKAMNDTAAAAKTAEAALNQAKQSHATAMALRDKLNGDVGSQQKAAEQAGEELKKSNEALAAATTALENKQKEQPAKEAEHKAADDAVKAAAAAEAAAKDKPELPAAIEAKKAADTKLAEAAAALENVKKEVAALAANVNTATAAQQGAKTKQDQMNAALAAVQKAQGEANAALVAADTAMKTAAAAHGQSLAAADGAAKAVPGVELAAKAAGEAAAAAKAQTDGSQAQLASIDRALAKWRAGQFNVQVLAAAGELDRKQAEADAQKARADELKSITAKTQGELEGVRKAIAEAPALLAAKTDEMNKAKVALDGAAAALNAMKADLAAKQGDAAAKKGAFDQAAKMHADVMNVHKATLEAVVAAQANLKGAVDSVAKANAAAQTMKDSPELADAVVKAQKSVENGQASVEAATKGAASVEAKVKAAADAMAQAKAAMDQSMAAVTAAQTAHDAQPAIIAQAQAAMNATADAMNKAKAASDDLPKRLAALEPAMKQIAADAESANQAAAKAAAEVAPLKQKHEGLAAEYAKLKPKG